MIRRFSTLYVGHIELEGCGLEGVPADVTRKMTCENAGKFYGLIS